MSSEVVNRMLGGRISLLDLAVSLRTWLHVLAANSRTERDPTNDSRDLLLHHAVRQNHGTLDGTIDDMLFVIQQKSIANRETTPIRGSRNTKRWSLRPLHSRISTDQAKAKQETCSIRGKKLEACSPLTTRRGRKARRRRSRACHRRRHR